MPSSSIWGTHLDALRQKFPGKVQILQTFSDEEQQQQQASSSSSSSSSSIIVQKLRVLHPSGWDLQIQLPQGFPDESPLITFAGYKPPYRWSPAVDTTDASNGTMLHEAVDHAVNALTKLSGSLGPINVNQIASSISSSSAASSNAAIEADALKALVDQTPFGIACQKELDIVWEMVENTCKSNLSMQPQIQQIQVEVAQLQHQVKSGLAGLGARRKDVLEVLPLGSSDGLVRSAKEELKELEDAANQACKALGSVSASKNLVENLMKKRKKQLKNNRNVHTSHRHAHGNHNQIASGGNIKQQQQQQAVQLSFNHNTTTSPSTTTANNITNNATDLDSIMNSVANNNNNDDTNATSPTTTTTTATRQAADIDDDVGENNNNNNNPSATTNEAPIFFVPTTNTNTAENDQQQQQQQAPNSAQSVFSSVAQPPLAFNLEQNNNKNNHHDQQQQQQQNEEDPDDQSGEESDDDEDEDVMDKAVEYAMKLCMEARKAAMLLRRFSSQ